MLAFSAALLGSLQHCKLQTSRAEKMWGVFHQFSFKKVVFIQEGLELCKKCDRDINLRAHDVDTVVTFDGKKASLKIH